MVWFWTQYVAWHVLRLGLCAALLWWDVRIGIFYVFATLQVTGEHLDRLRAIVRVFQVTGDARFNALARKLGVGAEDVTQAYDEGLELLTEKQRKSLDRDVELARMWS